MLAVAESSNLYDLACPSWTRSTEISDKLNKELKTLVITGSGVSGYLSLACSLIWLKNNKKSANIVHVLGEESKAFFPSIVSRYFKLAQTTYTLLSTLEERLGENQKLNSIISTDTSRAEWLLNLKNICDRGISILNSARDRLNINYIPCSNTFGLQTQDKSFTTLEFDPLNKPITQEFNCNGIIFTTGHIEKFIDDRLKLHPNFCMGSYGLAKKMQSNNQIITDSKCILLIGKGDTGREITEIIKRYKYQSDGQKIVYIFDSNKEGQIEFENNDLKIISIKQTLDLDNLIVNGDKLNLNQDNLNLEFDLVIHCNPFEKRAVEVSDDAINFLDPMLQMAYLSGLIKLNDNDPSLLSPNWDFRPERLPAGLVSPSTSYLDDWSIKSLYNAALVSSEKVLAEIFK